MGTKEEDKIKKQIFQATEEVEKAEKKIQEEKEKNRDSRQMDSKFSQDLEILFNRRNNLQKELAIADNFVIPDDQNRVLTTR